MTDPVDTDALRELLVLGAPPLSATAAEHDKWIGRVRRAGIAAADDVDRLRDRAVDDARDRERLRVDFNARAAEASRLRAVIENAPHDDGCGHVNWGTDGLLRLGKCTCWKADAL